MSDSILAVAEGQKDSYEIILEEEKAQYDLGGKIFEETIENAYPGMLLPIREIKIINRRKNTVKIDLDIDLVEPDFSWVDAKLMFIQNGQVRLIPLDANEQSVDDQMITLKPNEEMILKTMYQLDGEKIVNEHQNQLFKLKWHFSCRVLGEEEKEVFPNTGETANTKLGQFLGVGLLVGVIFFRRRMRET